MPYFITDESAECSGWAVVKDDGEVIGCHQTKADAIDQMVAVSVAEGIEPGGERDLGDPPAIIADIDGTILTFEGNPIGSVIDYLNAADATVYVVTARVQDDGASRDELEAAGLDGFVLVMKPDQDMDSVEYKRQVAVEILDDHEVLFAVDDDAEIRRVYERLGIETKTPSSLRSVRQVDLDVPQYIRDAAARGLELREQGFGGDGLVPRTIREARQMAAGDISEDKVIRANAWGARHEPDLDAPQNNDSDADGWPGNGAVAHYLWGINPLDPQPARDWFARKAEQIKAEAEEGERMTMTDTDIQIDAPKDSLVRHVEFRADPSDDGLTLEGYAAVFNEWTEIDSWEGSFRERIAPGAFRKTLSERTPILQFDHGTHPLIGSLPLGVFTSIKEDEHGLRVKARLSDNWLVQPIRDAIRDGAITGMSFRFRVIRDKWAKGSDKMAERTINEVALFEAGPVVFPAYEQTTVGVRSREVLTALSDPEVRVELARCLLTGTDSELAAEPAAQTDEPQTHSTRTQAQRRAILALRNL